IRSPGPNADLPCLPSALPGGGRHPGDASRPGRTHLSPRVPFRHFATDGVRRRPGARAIIVLLGLALALFSPVAARADASPFAAEGIRVVREDAAGVAFEMDVADPVFTMAGALDEHVVEMGIPFFQLGGATGAPGLPERVVWIGIPDGARVTVDGAGLDPW